jgi:DNA-binding NtrC family response regulator
MSRELRNPPLVQVRPDEIATDLDSLSSTPRDAPADVARVFVFLSLGDEKQLRSLTHGESLTVGRSAEADVVVDDSRVSRLHARLTNRGGTLVVEDLESRNGTRVNGHPVTSARPAARGDVIVVGPLEVIVATSQADGASNVRQRARPTVEPAELQVVAVDPAMVALFEMVQKLAPLPTNVLILGETGTGKEVVAEQLHQRGPRAARPFVRINCAALPDALLESELFGHEKGAFTGAGQRKIGHIEAATGGTLFLDEIGDMPFTMQPKLLRVLESKRLARLGGREEVEVDVRIAAATHRDLTKEVAAGRFREDLFYRLSAFTLRVPPLRDRKLEIIPLARSFAARFAIRAGLDVPALDKSAAAALMLHDWPGNARELRNAVEHATVMCDGQSLSAEHLPESVRVSRRETARAEPQAVASAGPVSSAAAIRDRVAEVERHSIAEALEASGGNRMKAAERLGISRRALLYKLAKYGIK